LEKWNFLRKIADPLSRDGHPIYVIRGLGYNTKEIYVFAKLIRELIDEKHLKDVILVSHSKGGLIGKHLLAFCNGDNVIKKLITVATPWGGSYIVNFIPHKSSKELHPAHKTIKILSEQKQINHKIVSIYGVFDNHVWPTKSCHLEGAKNIEVNTHGHHTILFNKEVIEIIQEETKN